MLDKNSEKFLKYINQNIAQNNSVTDIPYKTEEIGIPYELINDICKDLSSQGFIDYINFDDGVYTVFLRTKGKTYFKNKYTTYFYHVFQISISLATLIVAILAYLKE